MTKSPEKELFDALARGRANNGGKLNEEQWLAIARPFFEEKRRPRRSTPLNKMTEDEFLEWLEHEPVLKGIDIKKEIGKCQFHFHGKGRAPSRQRIVNWLMNAEKNLTRSYDGSSSMVSRAGADDEPVNWRSRLEKEFPGNIHSADQREWRFIADSTKASIKDALSRIK